MVHVKQMPHNYQSIPT